MSDTPPSSRRPRTSRPADVVPGAMSGLQLPALSDLERLEHLMPGATDRVLTEMRKQLEHQRAMQRDGMANARLVSLVALIGSFISVVVCAAFHQPIPAVAGGAVGVVDIVGLAVAPSSQSGVSSVRSAQRELNSVR